MLTIDELRAMPEGDRAGYLLAIYDGLVSDESDAARYQGVTEEYERAARRLRQYVPRLSV